MSILGELKRRHVLRVAALYLAASWAILQVADLLFDAFEVPSWSIRLLVGILLLGFPVALILSWIYQLTPDGLTRENVGTSDDDQHTVGRKINIAIAALLICAIGFIVIGRIAPETSPQAELPGSLHENSIAVMPFVNISDDSANEYFSDGLSEELLNVLASVQGLRVTARTSSFSYKDKGIDVRLIGQQLNVSHVLEGSVRKSGNQLRITAQLIDAQNGYHLWSATYDRVIDDVFAVQDEITAAVVAALRISILGEVPQVRVTDPQAFTAYLQALHFYQQRSPDSYEKAVKYLKQALEIDPDYLRAWNLLSATYSNQAIVSSPKRDELHKQSLAAIEKALSIDPNDPLSLSARAWLAMNYEHNYSAAATLFRRALDLSGGNEIILSNAAVLLSRLGRFDEAIEISERAIAINPVAVIKYVNLSDLLARAGRPLEAAVTAQKALELNPGLWSARINLAAAYLLAHQPEIAIAEIEQSGWPLYRLVIQTMAYHELGNHTESAQAFATLTEQYSESNPYDIVSVFAWKNEPDIAFEWLNRAIDEGYSTNGIRSDPFLKNLHEDVRWQPLLERLGLSDDQVATIEF